MLFQKLKKNNLPDFLFYRVIYQPFHTRGVKEKKHFLTLQEKVNKTLPDKHKGLLVYTSTKLGCNFNIKDITKKEHKHDLVYSVKTLWRHVTRHIMGRQKKN